MMLSLQNREWSSFRICDIFSISPGKRLTKSEMVPGDRPFIGASDKNNGVTAFVSNTNASEDSNVLGVNYNGSVVETFFHPYSCVFSDDVKRFRIKNTTGNRYVYLFLKTAIIRQKGKYTYGYKFNEKRMQKQPILLPVTDNGEPDYAFMEQYIKEREWQIVQNYISHIGQGAQSGGAIPPSDKQWREFRLLSVFGMVKRGSRLKSADQIEGTIPYASSSAENNGIAAFIGNEGKVRKYGNCLTVANSGSVGTVFYHPYEFIASDHVTALASPHLDCFSYLFVIAILSRLEEKYSFNREISDSRIARETILLPVSESGNPDWKYMSSYAKAKIAEILNSYLKEVPP